MSRVAQSAMPQQRPGAVRIGISGWVYPPWRGVFYPKGLRQADELAYASRAFSSIEINGSFYSLLRPSTYQTWFEQTPAEFLFAVKGGRFITHMKRLQNVETALANFFASGLLRLREKLGPILWQLPPNFGFDRQRLASFFRLLPRTTGAAAALARGHDARVAGRAETHALVERPLRHALEVRHPSFVTPEYIELLREYQVASCVADTAGLYPWLEDVTADFVYVRLHGAERLYTSGYGPRALAPWAARVRAWSEGSVAPASRLVAKNAPAAPEPRDVFVYFDNDVKVRAPYDAANLQRLLDRKATKRPPRTQLAVTEEPRTSWPAWANVARASARSR